MGPTLPSSVYYFSVVARHYMNPPGHQRPTATSQSSLSNALRFSESDQLILHQICEFLFRIRIRQEGKKGNP